MKFVRISNKVLNLEMVRYIIFVNDTYFVYFNDNDTISLTKDEYEELEEYLFSIIRIEKASKTLEEILSGNR